MMRGVASWAVAVRKPSDEQLAARRAAGEDAVDPEEAAARRDRGHSRSRSRRSSRRHRLLRLPVVRGVVALGESLGIGFKALGISANAQLGEEDEEISGGMWAGTVDPRPCCSRSASSSSSRSA